MGAVHGSATDTRRQIRSNRHWIRETSNSSSIDSRGMVLRYARTRPRHLIRFLPRGGWAPSRSPARAASSTTASCVGPTNVPPRSTGTPAIVVVDDRAADPVTALQHDDVVPEPDQVARRGQTAPRNAVPRHDDDVGVAWDVSPD